MHPIHKIAENALRAAAAASEALPVRSVPLWLDLLVIAAVGFGLLVMLFAMLP